MVAVEPLPPPGFVWATLDEDVSPNADVADILDGSVKAEGPAMAAIKQARNDAQAALSSSEQPAAAPATIAPTAGMTKTERLRAEGSAIADASEGTPGLTRRDSGVAQRGDRHAAAGAAPPRADPGSRSCSSRFCADDGSR